MLVRFMDSVLLVVHSSVWIVLLHVDRRKLANILGSETALMIKDMLFPVFDFVVECLAFLDPFFLDSIHGLPFIQLGFKRLGCLAFAYTVVIAENLLEVAQSDTVVGKHRIDSQRLLLSKDNITSGL